MFSVHAQWTSMEKCWAATVGAQASAPVDRLPAAPYDFVAGDDSAHDHGWRKQRQDLMQSKTTTAPFTKVVREACVGSTVSVRPPATPPCITHAHRHAHMYTHSPQALPPPHRSTSPKSWSACMMRKQLAPPQSQL